MSDFLLTGKCAVVTGGSSGIGHAIARRFAQAGARVLIADLRPAGEDFPFRRCDVSREMDVAGAFDFALTAFGRIDIVVNNAGIQPLGVPLDDLSGPLLDRTFAVNVNGVAFGLKHAGRLLQRGGRVVNLGSFVGTLGTPRSTAYAASKAAVIHLTRLGALELAPRGITVNAISPGTILTPAVTGVPDNPEIAFMESRTPLRRLGRPDEVAAACQFLASDAAAYITGHNLAVDGGLTAGWTDYAVVPPANVRDGRWVDDA